MSLENHTDKARITFLIVLLSSVVLNVGCRSSQQLTTTAAQRAVDKALDDMTPKFNLEPNSRATVIGIVEDQQTNTATADLKFSHVSFQCAVVFQQVEQRWLTGKALFKHYNDGRWVLTTIVPEQFATMACGTGWEGNIVVN
jgi:hypothetical protein